MDRVTLPSQRGLDSWLSPPAPPPPALPRRSSDGRALLVLSTTALGRLTAQLGWDARGPGPTVILGIPYARAGDSLPVPTINRPDRPRSTPAWATAPQRLVPGPVNIALRRLSALIAPRRA